MSISHVGRWGLLSLALGLASPAFAGWTANGVPITTQPGDQTVGGVAPDGAGGVFVLWSDTSPPTAGLHAQRLTLDGDVAPGWPASGITLAAEGTLVDVVQTSYGLFVLYESDRYRALQLRNDVAPAGWPRVGDPVADFWAMAVSDGAGGVLLNATSATTQTMATAVTSRMGAAGFPSWTYTYPFAQDTTTWAPIAMSLCHDGAGGAYLAAFGDATVLRVLRIDATGATPAGWQPTGLALQYAGFGVNFPTVVPSASGGVMVAWESTANFFQYPLRVARLNANGTSAGAPWSLQGITITSLANTSYRAGDAFGGMLVAWSAGEAPISDRLLAQVVPPSGSLAVPAGISVAESPRSQLLYGVVADGAGGGYVWWGEDRLRGSGQDVYVQRFDPDSPVWPDTGLRVCDAPGSQEQARLVVSGDQLFMAWTDRRDQATSGADVYVARITPDGVVPARMALVLARARHDRVELTWQAHEGADVALVQRSREGETWRTLSQVSQDGTDRFHYVDLEVSQGDRWAYRLGDLATGEPLTAAEWVDVPAAAGLAVRGFVAGTTDVLATLPEAGPARLDVFDVAGRAIESIAIDARGPGELRIGIPGDLAPGLYLLRLVQGADRVTARALRVR